MKNIFIKYRLIFIIGVPFLLFVVLISLIIQPFNNTQSPPIQAPTPSDIIIPNIPGSTLEKNAREGNEESVEERPGLLKKETLPDATIKYTFASKRVDRPHLFITEDEYTVLFQRMVISPAYPVKITDYTDVDGPPKWIFKGSIFYGPDAQTYTYPELGLAFIANPQTEEVFEQHFFEPTTVEEYVRKYGDDIPANPEP